MAIEFPHRIAVKIRGIKTYIVVVVLVTQSCPTLQPHGLKAARRLCPQNSPGKNIGVGSHSFLQGIFPTQGSGRFFTG